MANYEIDSFPYPDNDNWLPLLASLSSQLQLAAQTNMSERMGWLMAQLDAVVGIAYGLDPEIELREILHSLKADMVDETVNYAAHLLRGVRLRSPSIKDSHFNHQIPTLSALDRLIISHVPEGGNWQNIPESVPSARLEQIREMSAQRGVVRTTYYGRLRRDQPSYTINTYFNRPGNGTHIHPIENRTLTSREAARLQTFPDSYLFAGSDGAIRDQIGNAVPPLLARAIGKKLARDVGASPTCVDFFCGAGGLSLGLEAAGWHVMAAIDNNSDALESYCLNRPSDFEPSTINPGKTAVFRRDLHDSAVLGELVARIGEALGSRKLDLIVGGPPCQGFSHAGFRLNDDRRNDLAAIYLHFAEALRPRVFLLENVEGLATYKNGRVVEEIFATLRGLGYRTAPRLWRLAAEQYGVPQMRRRVFVVATLDDSVDLEPPEPLFAACPGRRNETRSFDLFGKRLPPPPTVAHAFAGLSMEDTVEFKGLQDWYGTSYSKLESSWP